MNKHPKRRTIAGQEIMDVSTLAIQLGTTEKAIRARVNRRTIPFRRWQGRIIFLRREVEQFLQTLPGCTAEEITRR